MVDQHRSYLLEFQRMKSDRRESRNVKRAAWRCIDVSQCPSNLIWDSRSGTLAQEERRPQDIKPKTWMLFTLSCQPKPSCAGSDLFPFSTVTHYAGCVTRPAQYIGSVQLGSVTRVWVCKPGGACRLPAASGSSTDKEKGSRLSAFHSNNEGIWTCHRRRKCVPTIV